MDSPQPPDSLSGVLADWRVAPRRDPQFRASISARINAGPTTLPWAGYVRRHAGVFVGAMAVAIVAGAIGGHERARARAAAESAQLAAAYVQGLDARLMTMR